MLPDSMSALKMHLSAIGTVSQNYGPRTFESGLLHQLFLGFRPFIVGFNYSKLNDINADIFGLLRLQKHCAIGNLPFWLLDPGSISPFRSMRQLLPKNFTAKLQLYHQFCNRLIYSAVYPRLKMDLLREDLSVPSLRLRDGFAIGRTL